MATTDKVKAAILGVSGYGGGELVRLLAGHPNVEVTHVASETYAGQPLSRAFPGLAGSRSGALVCQNGDAARASLAADVVFLAQESGAAMRAAGEILDLGRRVIDLSADFRLRDVDVYEHWYKIEHVAANLIHEGGAVYGLPELNRHLIRESKLVANPGCYPTATVLALAPLLLHSVIHSRGIIVDAKSGVSGAGRAKSDPTYRYAEANESVLPYGVGGVHRHVPEIEQELSACINVETPVRITFTPHLVPMTRGILATCYAPLAKSGITTEDILSVLRETYRDSPFVFVREPGDYPATKSVYGSNFCHLCAKVDTRTHTVIVTSVIDNLVKGASGQAIQNMNLMCGLPETAGLEGPGLWP
jgi:N-acetyl-gamma-glutamyl-phosphate reductase